ncbi:MAG: ABC transporter ATP-binding protein [Promethearchaeota archaeon]
MSTSTVKQDIKLVERSLKRTTSPGCDYDLPESMAKKIIRLRHGTDLISRLILQAGVNEYKESYLEKDLLKPDFSETIKSRVLNPSSPIEKTFNDILFKIFTKKSQAMIFNKKLRKLEKKKKQINKTFEEFSFREEFYFDKLTKHIVEQYEGKVKPSEYETLKLIFEFQKDLRFFNWNVVDKDPTIVFFFKIFQLLLIKKKVLNQNLEFQLDTYQDIINVNKDEIKPMLFEALYYLDKIALIKRRLLKLEETLRNAINKSHSNNIQKKKISKELDSIITKYIKQLYSLNALLTNLGDFSKKINGQKHDSENKEDLSLTVQIVDKMKNFANIDDIEINGLAIDDPEFILIKQFLELFKKIFSLLKKKRTMNDWFVIKRLLSEIFKQDRKKIILLLSVVFLNALIGMFIPLVFKGLIDYGLGDATVTKQPDLNLIYSYGFMFLAFSIFGVLFSITSNYLVQYLGNKTMYNMRKKMFDNLQKLSFDYYNMNASGKIISFITNDVETIQQLISSGFLTVFIDIFRLVGSVFLMVYISWQLTLTSFSIIPFILLLGGIIFKKARRLFVILRKKIAAVTIHLQQSIAGIRVIKSFSIEEKDYNEFNKANRENLEINLKAAKLFSSLPALITSVLASGIGVLLIVGGWLYIQSLTGFSLSIFTRGDLFSFIIYLFQFFGPIISMVQFVTNIQNSMAAGERIIRLIDARPSVQEKHNAIDIDSPIFKNLTRENVTVIFDNVNFEYEKGIPILKNINFRIRPKERLALVGYTGAGKTTLISLLARFWDVTSGRILINGYDLKNFSFRALRKLMSIVLQDNYLFSGTVMENIKYGKPDANDEEVYNIAKKLGVHDFFINMENGYDTFVRERGSRLSAGQKQMIAFARALLINPPILILDEATSSIDPYSEIIVKNALDNLLKGRMSITIAHRLSTVLNSDRIIVLDDGKIIEEGSHEDLISRPGSLYKHLYTMQFTKVKNLIN